MFAVTRAWLASSSHQQTQAARGSCSWPSSTAKARRTIAALLDLFTGERLVADDLLGMGTEDLAVQLHNLSTFATSEEGPDMAVGST